MNKEIQKFANNLYSKDDFGNPQSISVGQDKSLTEKQKIRRVKAHLKAELADALHNVKWARRMIALCV